MDASGWNQRYTDNPSPWTDQANGFLIEVAQHLAPGTALDLACGEGRNALWLARRGWTVTGLDFSDVAIRRATAAADSQGLPATFRTVDLTAWQPSETFDLVCVIYLHLAHDSMAEIMAAASRAVTPGGTLFVVGHHVENLTTGHGGPQSAEVLYSETDLARWCPLQVTQAERVFRHVDTADGHRQAVDALLVATRQDTTP
jgi:2-polyprenyl-3-methyl-5-hydroxy-6-metoxy-1,4-benzoquinol methylase